MKPRHLLVLFYSLHVVSSVTKYDNCQPKTKWSSEWLGSNASIITWIEETTSDNKTNLVTTLTITLQQTSKGSYMTTNYDEITIHRGKADITKMRNGTYQEENQIFSEPVGSGWQEFRLNSTFATEVWQRSVRLIHIGKDFTISTLAIRGSNVTVNCHKNELQWTVTSLETAIIPVSFEERNHTFSFYSNSKFNPIIRLGNSHESVILGWNGSSINYIRDEGNTHQSPLPEVTEHRVVIACHREDSGFFYCVIEAEQNAARVWSIYLKEIPTTMNVSTKDQPQVKILVLFHLPLGPKLATVANAAPVPQENKTHMASVECKDTAAPVIILSVCLVLAVLFIFFIFFYIWIKKNNGCRTMTGCFAETPSEPEEMPLLGNVGAKLWDAVVKNDTKQTENLLQKGANPFDIIENCQTTPYIEAHILAYKEILQIISRYKRNKHVTPPDEELMNAIIVELKFRENTIFTAAKKGRYGKAEGVKLLLEAYSLPATICDQEGLSLIHHIACASLENGAPAWDAEDIHAFLSNEEYYINAIDFKGDTPLHKISSRKALNSQDGEVCIWNNKGMKPEDAWLEMAKILLNYNCDPRIKNHRGILAQDLAVDNGHHELAQLFRRKCEGLEKINYQITLDLFSEMVDATRKGKTKEIVSLLMSGVPLLPIHAHADPLVEAIRCNQRDAVILLIGAGAPLANQSIGNVTPLEACHATVDLPAAIPALIIKACGNRLREEASRINLKDEMMRFKNQVIKEGYKAQWIFNEHTTEGRTKEAQELLLQAVEHGCSLFCQILSQENVHFHSFCTEKNAFKKAVDNREVQTQLSLCRDLKFSPFTFTFSAFESLDMDLRESILIGQVKILESACKSLSDSFLGSDTLEYIGDIKSFCDDLDNSNTLKIREPPDLLLYTIAKEGLDAILYIIKRECNSFDMDKIIDFSKSTLLHVAAMNGRLNVIEFLIFRDAKLDLKTVGGYTAAHLAALEGHKEAFTYIEEYMKKKNIDINAKCQVGLTGSEIMDIYLKVYENLSIPLLSHEDALYIMNEKRNSDKAYEILKRKGEVLKITKPQDLFDYAKIKTSSDEDTIPNLSMVMGEADEICKLLKNSNFGGKLLLAGPLQKESEISNVSDVYFILEIDTLHCTDDTQSITYKKSANRNNTTFELIHNSKSRLFKGTNFIQEFSNEMKKALLLYKTSSNEICLCPPFLTTNLSEVTFYLILKREKYLAKIAVHVQPVILISFPKEIKINKECEKYKKHDCISVYIFNSKGEWIFHSYHLGKPVFQELNVSQKKVREVCHLISKLLNPWPWAPPFSEKHFTKPWHTLSVGVSFLQPEAVNFLFLREYFKSNPSWEEDAAFSKLLSLYQYAAEKNTSGTWDTREKIESPVFSQVHYENNDSVSGVLRYLEDIQHG